MTRPLIIAHRGDSANAPENTLAAFQQAIAKGAEGIEFDVQLSKDGVPVVIHDHDLVRTGLRKECISELDSLQLINTDVGSWFNKQFAQRAHPEYADECVPTLESLLRLLKGYDGLIYIELKAGEGDHRKLAEAVCSVIGDSPQLAQMIVKSFKLGVIPEVRHHLPEVQTAALFAPEIMTYLRRREHFIVLAKEFGADQLSVHYSLATPRLCDLAAAAGMPLTVWTVDEPNWLIRRRDMPFKALITNDPSRMLRVFD